jgi:hypothetical protein
MPSFADLFPNLPTSVVSHAFADLLPVLPLPIPDTPENRVARDDKAIAALAALQPRDAAEMMFAVNIIACEAHALDCIRLAQDPATDARTARRCRTVGESMLREVRMQRRELKRQQAKAELRRTKAPPPPPPAPRPVLSPRDVEAQRQRAERIRALDLRLIETPSTMH